MFDKKPNAWFAPAVFAIGATVIVGAFVYAGLVSARSESLSKLRAEQEQLEEGKDRLLAEIGAAKEQLDHSKKEFLSLKSKLDSYRVQISKAERDKQTAKALLQLKADYQNGTKKGTYIEASHVGAGQNSLKVSLKNNDGDALALPIDHPDSDRLFQIIAGIEDLQSLTIRGLKLNDRALETIRSATSIGYLELGEAGLTDERCKNLLDGKKLWGLNLSHNPVTVIPACQADRLAILDFQDTRIDDEEARSIARRFPKTKHINLSRTRVTNAGIQSLATLVDMTFLEFCDVDVDDAGVEPLSKLKNLKILRLDDTNVTDPGLRFLGDMDALETVYVRSTGIADEGLGKLARRPKLHLLNVERTRITDDGLVKFCEQMNARADKLDGFTIMIDRQGRRSDIVELMHKACPKILVQSLKE